MTALTSSTSPRLRRRVALALLCTGTLAALPSSMLGLTTTAVHAAGPVSVVGLRQGDSGAGVTAVQEKLVAFGYYVEGGANGQFGPGTAAALRVFQRQNGLNPTGVVTENTARYLGLANGATTAAPGATPQPTAAPASGSAVGLRQRHVR